MHVPSKIATTSTTSTTTPVYPSVQELREIHGELRHPAHGAAGGFISDAEAQAVGARGGLSVVRSFEHAYVLRSASSLGISGAWRVLTHGLDEENGETCRPDARIGALQGTGPPVNFAE